MPRKRLEYEQPQPVTRAEVEKLLEDGVPPGIERTLVAVALNEPDLGWAYSVMVKAAAADDLSVRGTAVLCFGHLARIHGSLPDERAFEIVRTALTDRDDYVRGQAHAAASDLQHFIPAYRGMLVDD